MGLLGWIQSKLEMKKFCFLFCMAFVTIVSGQENDTDRIKKIAQNEDFRKRELLIAQSLIIRMQGKVDKVDLDEAIAIMSKKKTPMCDYKMHDFSRFKGVNEWYDTHCQAIELNKILIERYGEFYKKNMMLIRNEYEKLYPQDILSSELIIDYYSNKRID